jgi:aldose 1-epimerase
MKHLMNLILLTAAGLGTGLMGCATSPEGTGMIEKTSFGTLPNGTPVELYILRNTHGMEARLINYGGTLVSLKTPDKNGKLGDVVLGYDNLDGYLKGTSFFGAQIGRYGNRIARGKFSLNGRQYMLATNNYPNALHGGVMGFDKVIWQASPGMTSQGTTLKLQYVSKDGEEGYPGNLSVTATYLLTEDNELKLDYTATTDKDTVCNLTEHSYWNLRGSGNILDTVLEINAEKFTPVDSTLIPTGELKPVENTVFDFRKPTAIGLRINEPDEQLKFGAGYDHNFVLHKPAGELGLAARALDPTSGRVLEVLTTAPGVQFYTGNFITNTPAGKGGRGYQKNDAFCLEPQNFPDSPNHPDFPTTTLRAGETYKHSIVYRFSVSK